MAEETKTETKKAVEEPANNIIFVGKRWKVNKETGKKEFVEIPAPAFVIDGGKKFILPENVKNGSYMKDADRVIALFPGDFKKPVEKGTK